ncbi:MAG: 3-hydroxyacyl-ACP dehydratase FabZ [Elusimicrobia bacterium]|nr:3-hydroxyacyl-ACP dehydratase FabZ [Elusimicrobiota bacterium]MDE2237013.1 3-hydroxyacyl-ACP dehydratase FabZ [Elusimicrobiota bacterium]MDE2424366.1 3-hydroxyacyl-ACP dehydratase FabZ [Elusimicrobiota bacterium]
MTPSEGPAQAATPIDWSAKPARSIDILGVRKAIPHRYPFLLVDKVDVLQEDKAAVGTKMVTINEPFFQGHFPSQPVMPGVLLLEALAQTACVLLLSKGGFEDKLAMFMGIEQAKFRAPVLPGSVLKLNVEVLRLGRAGKFRGEAHVEGKLAAEGTMTFALVARAAAEDAR